MLMQKSDEFNIDLNVKDIHGYTAFHLACVNGEEKVVEMMINKAKYFELDLEVEDNYGNTGYELAKDSCAIDMDIFKRKLPRLDERI